MRWALLVGIAFVPVFQATAILRLIWGRQLRVPFWDEWDYAFLIKNAHAGTLGFHARNTAITATAVATLPSNVP